MLGIMLIALLQSASAQEVGSPPVPATPTELRSDSSSPSDEELTRAKELFENGRELFAEGSYSAAVTAWERAYEISGEPLLKFNIASAHEREGDYQSAIEALGIYRALGRVEDKAALERRLRNLERKAAESVETTPAPEPVAPTPAAKPAPTGNKSARIAGLTLMGVGAVGLGAGATLGVLSGDASVRAEDLCVNGFCPDSAKSDAQSAKSLALGADVLLATGAVALATGVVLTVTQRGKETSTVGVGLNRITFTTNF